MAKAKLSMRERYRLLTRDLDWTPTYVDPKDVYPHTRYEGIKIHDWDSWEDPFRLTIDSYCKYQAEKDKKLYAVIEGFAQGQGHLSLTDARYVNALKLFLQGVTPLEYAAHRHFGYLARHLDGPGARFAALCQSIDELRHTQTEIHTISQYNKYYGGLHNFGQMHDRVWYLSVPKSFFDDGITAGPFEFLTSISFSFEYLLTNLLFVPFMSGASFNGDLATMTFGFSAQSDESRHMTLGLEVLKFILEQDEGNVPIIQDWVDKWFWRGYRLLGLVAAMMDYMLPKKIMSWKEAFELYFEQQMLEGLFPDLEYYGIRPPRHVAQAIAEKDILSHQLYWTLYQFSHAAAFNTTVPEPAELDWMSSVYPDTFDRHYRPLWERARRLQEDGKRFFFQGLPMLCQVCQIPMTFTEPGDPTTINVRTSTFRDERFNFCSDGCKWIFDREPEKYVQSWLPVHQIYQGNCGGASIPDVLAWYGFQPGDGGEYLTSPDKVNWDKWHAPAVVAGGA
ncbi:YHS domain-containing protein [Pseudonocardia sp.]|uniref:YHS domain-containing protein n=1 Tax=Pseudonocardia sp. TaxID=60912 RepID=UPI003D0FB964